MNIPLAYSSVFLVVASLAIGPQAFAHGPAGHQEKPAAAVDEQAMKAQHERMESFKAAMSNLLEAVVDGNGSGALDQAALLAEALAGYEKDVPHKNVSRVKEFRAFYGEMKKRAAKLAADAGTGNLQKTSLAYGRVLEMCASCHAKFRD